MSDASTLRRAVVFVAVANLAYFGIEFAVALRIGSVSLFADSIDFLEDASVNLLVLMALNWGRAARSRLGMILATILLAPAVAAIWTAWGKLLSWEAPEPFALSLTGLGALAVNMSCAFVLAGVRHHGGSLTRAAFLSARNDVLANLGIIGAGLVTLAWRSAWPDIVVGIAIAAMNIGAAREVWEAARREGQSPQP